METVLAVAGGALTVIQALSLFILADLRARIMRLENRQMVGGD